MKSSTPPKHRMSSRSAATPTSSAAAHVRIGPDTGVVDSDHRAWSVPNLFIADGSVMPTQGSANPALTIMALASRLACRLDEKHGQATAKAPKARIQA